MNERIYYHELKCLNAGIAKLNEQISQAMVIHQMLGTQISDTLTLRKDCLFKAGDQDMITIYQPKTRRYEKPISWELAHLIRKAIRYADQHYKNSRYLFSDENDPEKPLPYGNMQNKVVQMIRDEDLRLGHKNTKNVKFYRKMSNQIMADETRQTCRRKMRS